MLLEKKIKEINILNIFMNNFIINLFQKKY